jgi:AbrB family looped-hinge helix DNA binding protein
MAEARITSKGQVTIPREIREKMGLQKGEHVLFDEKEGIVTLRKLVRPGSFEKWAGFLKDAEGQSPDRLIEELRG